MPEATLPPTPTPLAFDDDALERAWWAWFAVERRRVLRGGVAVMFAGVALFAPMDLMVFPEAGWTLPALRGLTLLGMAAALPAFFGPRSGEVMARHGQEWLLYVCTVAFVGLGLVGWVSTPWVPDDRLYVTLVAFCVALAGLYSATGLRVRYAGPLGVGMTLAYLGTAWAHGREADALLLAAALFGGGANLLGLVVSRELEREARSAFLRARELEREQARADALLLNIMPRRYADRLQRDGEACLDSLDEATVLFATVVGFTEATRGDAPLRAVALLDRLVAAFDELVADEDLERIKTIGATYMAVAGVTRGGEGHVDAAARVALRMGEAVRRVAADEGVTLSLRVGLATGPLVVGVIGRTRYAFDCWGDTVNTAARLDTAGEPGRVHGNAAAAARLREHRATRRGLVVLKGKGPQDTFWVGPP